MNLIRKLWAWVCRLINPSPSPEKDRFEQPKTPQNRSEGLDRPPLDLNSSSKISSKIREEFKRKEFLSELKSSQTLEKQFEPIKEEFVKEIKDEKPKKSD